MLIIGCGFHRQIDARSRPLASWPCLLQRLADTLNLHPTASLDHPTFFWEELIFLAGKLEAFAGMQASVIEKSLKKESVKLLNAEAAKEAATYEGHSLLASLAASFAKRPGHIMSLNFDPLILKVFAECEKHRTVAAYGGSKAQAADYSSGNFGGCRVNDRTNLFRRESVVAGAIDSLPTQVWFPHGTVKKADTLRLGLRDYGFQPIACHYAFKTFKSWERKVLQGVISGPSDTRGYEKLLAALQTMDRVSHDEKRAVASADHWVTRFMLSDITIIGAGLAPAETGLHWLIVQRERNLARIADSDRPKLRFFSDEPSHNPFLNGRRDLSNGDWTEAWLSC
jgi:hypothetical protein